MMEDKEKIKRWATDRLAEVEADIAKRFGISERFYQDLFFVRNSGRMSCGESRKNSDLTNL